MATNVTYEHLHLEWRNIPASTRLTIKQIHSFGRYHPCLRRPRENREPAVSRRKPPLSAEIRSPFIGTRVLRQLYKWKLKASNFETFTPRFHCRAVIHRDPFFRHLPPFDWKFISEYESKNVDDTWKICILLIRII